MAPDPVITGDLDYRDRILALEADDPAEYLPATGTGWRRIFARLQPEASSWAVLAFEPNQPVANGSAWMTRMVEVCDAGAGGTAAVQHPAGDLVITPLADDVKLSGLRPLADNMGADWPGSVTLLRYRPHRRCTLRVAGHNYEYVVKALADDRGERFHRDAGELWRAAQRGELGFRVAEPIRWDDTTRSVWQGIVPGMSLAPLLLGAHGESIARRMGAALGTLARSNVLPSTTVTSDDQLRRTRRAVGQAIRRVPALTGDLERILGQLATRHAALSQDRLVPVHGAPHMHQWLVDGDHQLGLIDFDGFALGEIELDIATLIVELDYEGQLTQPIDTIEDAIIAGFGSSGCDVDRSRLQLYRAHKRMSKVTREAWALRTDGERRARRHIPRILAELE